MIFIKRNIRFILSTEENTLHIEMYEVNGNEDE